MSLKSENFSKERYFTSVNCFYKFILFVTAVLWEMNIEVLGYARVKWKRMGPKDSRTWDFTGEQKYLSSKTYLISNSESGIPSFLPPGNHSYNFEISLPNDLPSSFTGKHGHVRYEVTISIAEMNGDTEKFEQPFTVIRSLDLNSENVYNKPIQDEEVTEITYCLCFKDRLKAKCSLPLSGYVPGQKIPLTLHVDNETNYHCFGSRVKLMQIVTYKSKRPNETTISETFKIADQKLGRIESYSSKDYLATLDIPPVPPTTQDKHHMIRIRYEVSFFVHTAANRSVEVRIPITVGTVPLLECGLDRQAALSENMPSTATTDGPMIAPASQTFNPSAPPSYEEAIAFPTEPSPNDGEIELSISDPYSYLPRYAVYSNYPLPTSPTLENALQNLESKGVPSCSTKKNSVKYGWKL